MTAVFSKENGIYARYALMRMLELGYQARAGVLTAGNYGTPQVGRGSGVSHGLVNSAVPLTAFCRMQQLLGTALSQQQVKVLPASQQVA